MYLQPLRRFGAEKSPVVVVDQATGAAEMLRDIAARLAPFPPARGNAYPGRRRFIGNGDVDAARYARALLQALAPAINAAFSVAGFDLLTASFSLVTTPSDALAPVQRAPHFDSPDPLYFAVLHYLSGTEGSGTAFYRQRSTGIERVTADNRAAFIATAQREAEGWHGYISSSTPWFEQTGVIEAALDRVAIYQGSLLHSGIIPADMAFSDDPLSGRLTANFFIRGRPRAEAAGQAGDSVGT